MNIKEIIRRAEKELQTATRNLETAKRRGAPEQDVRNLEAKVEYRKFVFDILTTSRCEQIDKVKRLEKENAKLLARAEQAEARSEKAERERDEAISDLTWAVNEYRRLTTETDLCGLCKYDLPPAGENGQTYECPGFCKDDCFKWRGQKEE